MEYYYYIKDSALEISNGKVQETHTSFDLGRETKPIIGNMYQYHIFPMLFIFILISFISLWYHMTIKLLGKCKRLKAVMLGFTNLITAIMIMIEDFAWFVNRYMYSHYKIIYIVESLCNFLIRRQYI
jgi:hypothetical protein